MTLTWALQICSENRSGSWLLCDLQRVSPRRMPVCILSHPPRTAGQNPLLGLLQAAGGSAR